MKHVMRIPFMAGTLLLFVSMIPPHSFRSPDFNQAPKKEILVAAAADLKFAMDSLVTSFSKDYPGIPVKVVYGSSGNFFEQISNGAPFDLFFSADIDFPRKLAAQNKTISTVKSYGKGEIVLWSKKLDPAKEKMNTLLSNSIVKIAIANPVHAPYGKRAVESLNYYKIYDKITNKLVVAENISQTALYVTSGAADIGIVALSLALSPAMKREGGKYWLIPGETHEPLEQGYVILQHGKGNTGAVSFAGFMGSAKATAIMKYFGYSGR